MIEASDVTFEFRFRLFWIDFVKFLIGLVDFGQNSISVTWFNLMNLGNQFHSTTFDSMDFKFLGLGFEHLVMAKGIRI